MKRFLMINTMILALAATSAFAISHKQPVSRSSKPAATQAPTGTAAKPSTTSRTTKKKRHHKNKATKSAAEMKGGATKKN